MGAIATKIFGSSLFKASGIYTISSLINSSIPFIFIPILTRTLSPADYGILSIVAIMINIATPVVGLSVNSAIGRKYFEDDARDFPRYVGNSFYILVASVVFCIVVLLTCSGMVERHTGIDFGWQLVVLTIAAAQFISFILLAVWQVLVKPISYGLFQIANSVTNFLISILLIFSFELGWEGRIYGQMAAALLFAFLAIIILGRQGYVLFRFNAADIKHALRFSIPLIPHTLGGLAIAFTDRILIANMIGLGETGVYTVAYQLASVLSIVNNAFITAYVPWLYGTLAKNERDANLRVVRYSYGFFILQAVIVIAAILVFPFIIRFLVGGEYSSSSLAYFNLIITAFGINGMYLMVAGFIFYTRKTYFLSIQTMIAAAINVPLCYFMIRLYGPLGAAISMVIIFLLMFLSTWTISSRLIRLPWKLR